MTYRPPTLRTLFAALVALALLATSCGGGSSDVATTTTDAAPAQAVSADESAAEPAPAEASLVATTVGGSQIDFGSLEGQDVVLWFWAPW